MTKSPLLVVEAVLSKIQFELLAEMNGFCSRNLSVYSNIGSEATIPQLNLSFCLSKKMLTEHNSNYSICETFEN